MSMQKAARTWQGLTVPKNLTVKEMVGSMMCSRVPVMLQAMMDSCER